MGFKAPCEAVVHMAFDWDDNSRFFHSLASNRKYCNFIQTLEAEGIVHTTHAAKENILHQFYASLLSLLNNSSLLGLSPM
jgi:hypothetical protein